MTGKKDESGSMSEIGRLVEFEVGTANSLAPFEDDCAIMLDDFSEVEDGLLEEFESSLDVIHLDETLSQDDTFPDDSEEPEELDEVEDESEFIESVESEEDVESIGIDIVDDVPPYEPESDDVIPEDETAPSKPVIGFICGHAADISSLTDDNGMLRDRPGIKLVSVPCAGMVKPSWLKYCLEKGSSGVLIVSCKPGCCHHRTGAEIIRDRVNGTRRPMLLSSVDSRRVKLMDFYKTGWPEILEEIDKFIDELSKLNGSTKEQG